MAENFIVSARKYRPDSWDTVIGQKHITSTLQNAIANNQIAQAYLFTGPRGVGKTTCARIFAKAVNDKLGQDLQDMQFNVFELDAASNNSVDDIRGIVDTVRIPPQEGRYKVYIIDEVHMLSPSAFNAFLKTLEEPPAHAIFILATTEKHKIIPTILSRCQIFDFNRIRIKDMTEHLKTIAAKEGIVAEEAALHVIATKADGAMRDALSIFDQVVAFCGKNLTYAKVIDNLNVLDYDYYFRLTDLILKEDISGCLILFDEVLNAGFDAHNFITGLGGHFRNLMVSSKPETVQLMEVSDDVAQKYITQAKSAPVRLIIQALDFINECEMHYRESKHQRLLVEITLMKMASILYNAGEGEKKKFRLKPFRSVDKAMMASAAQPPLRQAPPTAPVASPLNKPTEQEIATPVATQATGNVLGKRNIILQSGQFSIKQSMMNSAQVAVKQEAELAVKEARTRDYNLEEIKELWSRFSNERLSSNMQVQAAFRVAQLEMKNADTLLVSFPSETQKMYFNDSRALLGEFLRNEGDIRGLDFEVDILKPDSIIQTYKTDKQQFEELVAKNPSLEVLRKTFKLQVDF